MKGKHKIEVRSGRVVFTIELERNITILRGDSATGKTTLVEMLQAYETYGRQSGVTVSCDKSCRVLSGVNWELQLNATYDSIVFVDEGSTFISSLDFARAIQHSDNYYVLVTREDLSTLPYSVNAILELKKTTSRFKRTYNKACFASRMAGDCPKISENRYFATNPFSCSLIRMFRSAVCKVLMS